MDVHNFLVLIYTFRLCHICVYDILLSNIYRDIRKMERHRFGHDMLYQKTIYYPSIEIYYLFKFEIESSNFLFIFQLIVLRKIYHNLKKSLYNAYFYLTHMKSYQQDHN